MSRRNVIVAAIAAILVVVGVLVWIGRQGATRVDHPSMVAPAADSEEARSVREDATPRDEPSPTADAPQPRLPEHMTSSFDAGSTATGEPIPHARDLMRMSNFKRRQYFDRRAARAAGLSEAEIDRVFEEWAEAEHEIHQRIAANHAAGRRVRPGTRSYDKQLREFLDDEDYDVALYATGQRNRVELVAPAPGRGEMAAGLQPGDIVETYDGQPVFRLTELQQMIKRTGYGTDVPVVVRRGGEMVELTVPGKHPLGPKTSERAAPMSR